MSGLKGTGDLFKKRPSPMDALRKQVQKAKTEPLTDKPAGLGSRLPGRVDDPVRTSQGRPSSRIGLPDAEPKVRPQAAPGDDPRSSIREEAEQIWFDEKKSGDSFRRIERDAADVNEATSKAQLGGGRQTSKDAMAAQALVEENRPQEEAALARMTPAQRDQYARVAQQTEGDPHARLALQILVTEGTLPGSRKANDGDDLLKSLDELTTQPLAEGIDRQKLVSDLVQEIAVPSSINQKNRGTCTMASTQILMAMESPAEYARLVGGLASPEGKVRMANGDELVREPGTETEDGTRRSISSRLFQPAAMEYANGSEDYRNTRDGGGLNYQEVDRAVEALSGKRTTSFDIDDGNRSDSMDRIADKANGGDPVLVGLEWGEPDANGVIHGGHKVLVTRVEDDRVYYNNPWGSEESMSRREFEARLNNANLADFDPSRSRPASWAYV